MSKRQVGANEKEIEITPEMIEAGLPVLQESGELEYETSSQDILISRILGAAFGILRGPREN